MGKVMKVVVTGATGFVGRYTVRRLLDSGYEVISITTNKSITYDIKKFLKGSCLITVNSLEDVSKEIVGGNSVIHCAWSNVHSTGDLSHYAHASEQVRFLSKISLFRPCKVIITGTCFEFGLLTGPVSVSDKSEPNTPYAQAKDFVRHASERILKGNANIHFIWARLFYIYGNGQHENSIYSQLLKAIQGNEEFFNMSKGEQLYDYMTIEKVAEQLTCLVSVDAPPIVHICNGYPISLRRLVEEIIVENKSNIKLKLGYYPYRTQDSIALWGNESFDSQVLSYP